MIQHRSSKKRQKFQKTKCLIFQVQLQHITGSNIFTKADADLASVSESDEAEEFDNSDLRTLENKFAVKVSSRCGN